MAANRATAILLSLLLLGAVAPAQQKTVRSGNADKGQTVRRHRVAEDSVSRAEAAIEKKDYAAAEQILLNTVKQDANDYRAWFDLGFIYNATDRPQEAINAYKRSVAANPKIFESNLNLGLNLARTGDPDAEKYLRAATQLTPASKPQQNLAQAWMSLGHVLEKKDPKTALHAFAQAAKLLPSDADPHLAAAALAARTGDPAMAEKEYTAAAQLDPKSPEPLAGLVNLYIAGSRLEEAEAALRKYIAAYPGNGAAHVQLARVLARLHRRPEALAELDEGLKLSPADASARRLQAGLYLEDKQYDKAEAQFRALLAQAPNDGELHFGVGLALLNQKKYTEAQSELLAAIKLKPDLGDAYEGLATAASQNKDYALTVRVLEARTKLLPDTPWTLFLRATAYDHLGDRQQAAANYHQFLAVADGRFPDQEWQARHRLVAIEPKKK